MAGVPGIWYRPREVGIRGTILYLHGGGYVGTSPRMYALFVAWLCRRTGCEIFVADLRLAPEFPFPAGLEDAVLVLEALLAGGTEPDRLFVAGDSSGGGLVTSLIYSMQRTHHRPIAGVMLFSPGAGPAARRAVDDRQRRPGHPALEHPHLRLPARTRSPVRRRCRPSTRTCRAGRRPSCPSGATRCSVTPSASSSTTSEAPGWTPQPSRSRGCSTCSPSSCRGPRAAAGPPGRRRVRPRPPTRCRDGDLTPRPERPGRFLNARRSIDGELLDSRRPRRLAVK